MIARIVHQKRVMAARSIEFEIGKDSAVVEQRTHDLARSRRRETPVRLERDYEECGLCTCERRRQVTAEFRRRISYNFV